MVPQKKIEELNSLEEEERKYLPGRKQEEGFIKADTSLEGRGRRIRRREGQEEM